MSVEKSGKYISCKFGVDLLKQKLVGLIQENKEILEKEENLSWELTIYSCVFLLFHFLFFAIIFNCIDKKS